MRNITRYYDSLPIEELAAKCIICEMDDELKYSDRAKVMKDRLVMRAPNDFDQLLNKAREIYQMLVPEQDPA